MKKIFLVLPFLTLMILLQITSAVKNATESNEISSNSIKKTRNKINPDIRSVLLQAINKLEKEAEENNDQDDENHNSSSSGTENPNFIPTVQFYTASAEENGRDISPDGDVILKTIFKNVAPSKEFNADDIKIHFAAPAGSSSKKKTNSQQTRSLSSNEISDVSKSEIITPTTIRPKLDNIKRKPIITTTTTTTTKKPAPTHNEDGENIEVVEKKDIKIFKAPLVTAFSVEQDDKGILKKVVPLIHEIRAGTTTVKPDVRPLFPGGAVIEKLKVTATNVSNILLPTPSPTKATTTVSPPTSNSISNELKGIPVPSFLRSEVFKSNSFTLNDYSPILPFAQQQNLFSAQQSLPLATNSNNNSNNPQSLNNYLLERQRYLEQQIFQLQIQARQQQEQLILQQRLLEEQRRAKLLEERNSGLKNQVNSPTKNFKSPFSVRPSLEIIPSISQSTKYEVHTDNINNHLPDKNAINFHPTFIPINSNNFNNNHNNNHLQHRTTSVQIQPANQLNFISPQSHFVPPSLPSLSQSASSPLELSTFPQLPQKSFQLFKSQPQLPLQQQFSQPISLPEHLQPRTRHFRQESGVGNFGTNSFFNSDTSNRFSSDLNRQRGGGFIPDQSQNVIFQPGIPVHNYEDFSIISKVLALNHGISPFTTTQNFHFTAPGQFAGNF